jgi:hypothetical protein|tara:strand:- start:2379 stop:2720 length:342 start_codon:yes stop_codon:yes gene_type:complete
MPITWTINNEMVLQSADADTNDDYVVNATFIDVSQGVNHTRNFKLDNKPDTDEGKAEIQTLIDEQIQPQQNAGTLPNNTVESTKFKNSNNPNSPLISEVTKDKATIISSFKKS